MSTLRALLWLALAATLAACSDDPPPKVEPEPAPSAPPAAPAPPELEPTADEVPIAEDFEAQAAEEIKPDNLSGQLDAIEKEIELDSQ